MMGKRSVDKKIDYPEYMNGTHQLLLWKPRNRN
jgi:hypothetical protein